MEVQVMEKVKIELTPEEIKKDEYAAKEKVT